MRYIPGLKFVLLGSLTLSLSACQSQQTVDLSNMTVATPHSVSQEEASQKATEAFQALGGRLKAKLEEAMKAGGPVQAVVVCRDVAPTLADEVSEDMGFPVGRSSHKLRNSKNAPLEAVSLYLQEFQDKPASQASPKVVDQGELWVVVGPIPTQPLCLTCHGDSTTFSAELKEALAEHYPDDQATGFKAGDLRGVFWAQIPKTESISSQSGVGDMPIKDASSRKIKTH